MYTVYCSDSDREKALGEAKGAYQRGLLLGTESWTGSTVRGLASEWPDSYEKSRQNLLNRLHKAGLEYAFEQVEGNRVLVVGANRPSSWERLSGEVGADVLDEVREFWKHRPLPNQYMEVSSPDAFKDFPPKLEKPPHLPTSEECPVCKGHGGWNLQLNAYSLHSLADTAENRHRYAHFRSSCSQCMGYGWTTELTCIHDYQKEEQLEMFQQLYRCSKCDSYQVWDSSG